MMVYRRMTTKGTQKIGLRHEAISMPQIHSRRSLAATAAAPACDGS